VKNATYKRNIEKLENFAMYMFANDTTVVPKETAFFQEVNTTSGELTRLEDRLMYKEDWLGLRTLNDDEKLHIEAVEGEHMHLSDEILTTVFKTYFGN